MTEHPFPADRWRSELRRRLVSARKERDAVRTSSLRSALSAIDNGETPDGPVPSAGAIADSATGPGAAEVARRELSEEQIRDLIQREVDERRGAASQLDRSRPERAAGLREEAEVLEDVLRES
jgi:uncharacterized protein YqeY